MRLANCRVGCRHCSINFASPNAPLPYGGGVFRSASARAHSPPSNCGPPRARSPNYLLLAAGNLTGTSGEGAHHPAGLRRVSMALQRFHQQDEFLGKHGRVSSCGAIRYSCAVIAPREQNRRAIAAPEGRFRGAVMPRLPQLGDPPADGLLLPEHPIRVLLLRANVLCFGAGSANFLFRASEPVN